VSALIRRTPEASRGRRSWLAGVPHHPGLLVLLQPPPSRAAIIPSAAASAAAATATDTATDPHDGQDLPGVLTFVPPHLLVRPLPRTPRQPRRTHLKGEFTHREFFSR